MFCEFSCKIRIIILTFFFNINISRIDVFARNVRNIIYFCKHIFNDYISDILCIILLCNFFCNILSFLYLISWSFSVELIYLSFLRRVFILSLMDISFSRYFLRVISRFLFITSSAWFRRLFLSFSLFRFWCFKTCF